MTLRCIDMYINMAENVFLLYKEGFYRFPTSRFAPDTAPRRLRDLCSPLL